MLNYLCLAALCVCAFSAPVEKTDSTTTTPSTTTTTTTPKTDAKSQAIDNLTPVEHPAGTLQNHPVTKRQYDHHPVAVLVGHDHYVSGAAFHAPILVSDDHVQHIAATHASIASGHSETAAPSSISNNDRHERSKEEKIEKTTAAPQEKVSTTQAASSTSTSSTTASSVDTKKVSEHVHAHPAAHLTSQAASSTTPATTASIATSQPINHSNHKRNTHVDASKTVSAKSDETAKLASNPTIASPAISKDQVPSKIVADSPKSNVPVTVEEQPKVSVDTTSAAPTTTTTDKSSSLHKHKRDASLADKKVEATSEKGVDVTTPKTTVKLDEKATATAGSKVEAVSKKTSETHVPEHASHKRETTRASPAALSSKDAKNVATATKDASIDQTTSSVVVESVTKKATDILPSQHVEDKKESSKVNIKADVTKEVKTETEHTKHDTTKTPARTITEHSHGKTNEHDQHKREAKDDEKKTHPVATLSNPTIASPVALLTTVAKAESAHTTESTVEKKPTATAATTTKKPENDSQKKAHKRETTKDDKAAKESVAKPEPLTNLSKPTIDDLLKSKEAPKYFHTSHKIPEHIEAARLHDDGKFQTSHQIPVHAAPVVVGVTPKKPVSSVKDETTKVDSSKKDEILAKEETKENNKKPIPSRHRRDTSTTPKPVDTKPTAHLARVPLTKSKPVEVESPKQQNGHAAHSDSARIKRESKTEKPVSQKPVTETHLGEEHHPSLVFPVPVDQIVKHSNAAPELHHTHSADNVHPVESTSSGDISKQHKSAGAHKLDKKHVVNQPHSSTTETPISAAQQLQDAAVSVKPVA